MAYTKITLNLDDLRKLEQEGRLTIPAYGVNVEVQIVLDKPKNVATGAEIKDFWDNGWDGNSAKVMPVVNVSYSKGLQDGLQIAIDFVEKRKRPSEL